MYKKQQGVVLVISLIMLLLMTIVGVTSMQTTILQEKMAGNLRDKHIAFNSAEAALQQGEADLTAASLPTFGSTTGLYSATGTSAELWKTINWDATDSKIYPGSGMMLTSGLPLPRYIIEELPVSTIEKTSVVVGFKPEVKSSIYQVTARGEGKMGAVAILQSTYLR